METGTEAHSSMASPKGSGSINGAMAPSTGETSLRDTEMATEYGHVHP
jgi:hypothetical protein